MRFTSRLLSSQWMHYSPPYQYHVISPAVEANRPRRPKRKTIGAAVFRESPAAPALENGAEALLAKPIDSAMLRSEIDTRVKRAA